MKFPVKVYDKDSFISKVSVTKEAKAVELKQDFFILDLNNSDNFSNITFILEEDVKLEYNAEDLKIDKICNFKKHIKFVDAAVTGKLRSMSLSFYLNYSIILHVPVRISRSREMHPVVLFYKCKEMLQKCNEEIDKICIEGLASSYINLTKYQFSYLAWLSTSGICTRLKNVIVDHNISIRLGTYKLSVYGATSENVWKGIKSLKNDLLLSLLHFELEFNDLNLNIDGFTTTLISTIFVRHNLWFFFDYFGSNKIILILDSFTLLNIHIGVDIFFHLVSYTRNFLSSLFFIRPIREAEFISGKKDGKLFKIESETGCSIFLDKNIPLLMFNNEEYIKIRLCKLNFDCDDSIRQISKALSMVYGELPAEITFYIPPEHHKRLIGIGGSNIQVIMKQYDVFIKFINLSIDSPRKDNVLIRTPSKNRSVLVNVQNELRRMSNNILNIPDNIEWQYIDFSILMDLSPQERQKILILNVDLIQTEILCKIKMNSRANFNQYYCSSIPKSWIKTDCLELFGDSGLFESAQNFKNTIQPRKLISTHGVIGDTFSYFRTFKRKSIS